MSRYKTEANNKSMIKVLRALLENHIMRCTFFIKYFPLPSGTFKLGNIGAVEWIYETIAQ